VLTLVNSLLEKDGGVMTFARLGLIFLLVCSSVWAQSSTAQINGNVSDSGGLSVPGAEVKVTQTATGLVRTVTSAGDGNFVFPNLPVGPYLLEVSKAGFNKFVQSGIVLQVSANPTIDAVLKVGSVNEQVTVQADATMVETRSTGVGTVVDNARVIEMPLNGRNATELVFLAGMATIGGANGGFLNSVRNYPTVMISVAGGVANQQAYSLDGANHNDAYNGLNLPLPFPDALQEFKVENGALPAQYGVKSAVAVNAVTKSGTNQYHGNLFEFFRNGSLNARNFFAPRRDTLKRSQFGGTIGGPIKKDKLFFFAGYQGTIQKSDPPQNIAYVPTPAMLNGDFTALASAACNGGTARTLAASAGFVNNVLPVSLLNPAALKITARLPSSSDPCGKVTYGLKGNQDEHMVVSRLDWQQSDKHSMFTRFYITKLKIPTTYDGKNALTLNSNTQDDQVMAFVIGDTYLIGSGVVNSFRASVNRSAIPKIVDNFATWPELGVNAPYNPAPAPRIAVTGNAFNIGSGNSIINHDFTGPNYNFTNDVSFLKGSHQIGIGANYMWQLINYVSGINATGLPTFDGSITGLSLADFMTGRAARWTQGNISYFYNRQHYAGAYIQDSWKASRHLTINYGVRWEPWLPIRSKQGLFMNFRQDLFDQGVKSQQHVNAPAGVIFPTDSQWTSGNSIARKRWATFVPRFGLVWDPKGDGKMTLRAAIGSYTDRSGLYALSSFGQDPPIGNVVTINNVNLSDPWANYPGGNPLPILRSRNMPWPTAGALITYPQDWKPLWVNQWNVSLQRQVGTDWLFTANYVGNNTFHLVVEDQLNAAQFLGTGACTINNINYATCSTQANINQRRPLYLAKPSEGQLVGIVSEGAPHGTASYNGLYVATQKRMSKGTSVLANYTFAHCISDLWNGQPGNNGVSTATPRNRRADRSNCAPNGVGSDVRHQFNLSIIAQTPKFANKMLNRVAGDWQFSPIVKIRSGNFFSITTGTDTAISGQQGQRANLVDPNNIYPATRTVTNYINRAAFANPALGTLGNLGPSNILGPGSFALDLSVARTFQVREGHTIQVRGESFNLPNHFNPANPVSALNSPVFGQIQSDISGTSGLSPGAQRIIQLALKYVF
jgi:Carboxypeptidase regulatory-like domain